MTDFNGRVGEIARLFEEGDADLGDVRYAIRWRELHVTLAGKPHAGIAADLARPGERMWWAG